ncbi:hypothetical protein BJ742DRAFT_741442 [Cladochytrium replicatum]|nr:hypothetical protein BJ742DRAFT_741442 [Cladochytrium replicatum]
MDSFDDVETVPTLVQLEVMKNHGLGQHIKQHMRSAKVERKSFVKAGVGNAGRSEDVLIFLLSSNWELHWIVTTASKTLWQYQTNRSTMSKIKSCFGSNLLCHDATFLADSTELSADTEITQAIELHLPPALPRLLNHTLPSQFHLRLTGVSLGLTSLPAANTLLRFASPFMRLLGLAAQTGFKDCCHFYLGVRDQDAVIIGVGILLDGMGSLTFFGLPRFRGAGEGVAAVLDGVATGAGWEVLLQETAQVDSHLAEGGQVAEHFQVSAKVGESQLCKEDGDQWKVGGGACGLRCSLQNGDVITVNHLGDNYKSKSHGLTNLLSLEQAWITLAMRAGLRPESYWQCEVAIASTDHVFRRHGRFHPHVVIVVLGRGNWGKSRERSTGKYPKKIVYGRIFFS